MIQIKKREFKKIVNKLKEKFALKERHTGDWRIRIFHEGKLIAGTKCSEGKDDIPPIIVQKIKKQLYFADDKELVGFKKCPLTCEDYLNLLRVRDVL